MPRPLPILAALCATACLGRAADLLETRIKTITDAYALVEANAADAITPDQALYQGAIPGLLRNLDPHSIFFDPDNFQQMKRMERSTQKGFGTVVSILPARVIVLQVLPGTPGAKAGLTPGDDLLAVNGYEIARLDQDQIAELLSESRQNTARLVVRHPGAAGVAALTLIPEDQSAPSVDRAFFVGAGIGYIHVTSFEGDTADLIKKSIEKLGGSGLAGLVLDLRGNPGGLVDAAVQTCSLFLPPGSKVVTLRGRHVPETTQTVPTIAEPYQFRMAILIDGKSASASEIVTGAMQDHDRATVLGEPSFGKGLVQNMFPLSEGTGLALTTALYYTPSGRSIQKPLDPSKFELGDATAHPNGEAEFHTDAGRTVTGGGGIQPDIVVYPRAMNRLRAVLEDSGAFPDFATEYLSGNKIPADFEITPALMGRFRTFLLDRRIQPSETEWTAETDFMSNRLLTEIFNQAFGVEKGDEVQARRDPVIQKALDALSAAAVGGRE
ncbi:MAG TPA: S41 family peptidase [Bryobacteraceae bacterium]|nr:S41 family peptidase [Bryobacteraceae bacterium]